jgi:hypothetical protein
MGMAGTVAIGAIIGVMGTVTDITDMGIMDMVEDMGMVEAITTKKIKCTRFDQPYLQRSVTHRRTL